MPARQNWVNCRITLARLAGLLTGPLAVRMTSFSRGEWIQLLTCVSIALTPRLACRVLDIDMFGRIICRSIITSRQLSLSRASVRRYNALTTNVLTYLLTYLLISEVVKWCRSAVWLMHRATASAETTYPRYQQGRWKYTTWKWRTSFEPEPDSVMEFGREPASSC